LTAGKMLDFTVEAAGSCQTIELAFSLINKHTGQCIFASHPPAGQKIQIDPFELICGKTITGSWGGCSHPEHMTDFVSTNKEQINFETFMSDIYPFKNINQALDDLKQQKILRAIVRVS
jgi:S-(hydroxymethyl)glutathione dehydrogenase/alcohol dehydrogenase